MERLKTDFIIFKFTVSVDEHNIFKFIVNIVMDVALCGADTRKQIFETTFDSRYFFFYLEANDA